MNEMNGKPVADLDLEAARMARVDRVRLKQLFDHPQKGPSARYAYDNLIPFYRFLISEKRKGTHPELLAVAMGQFFAQALYRLAMETGDKHQTCRIGMDVAMNKLQQCFRAGAEAALIVPAKPPGVGVDQWRAVLNYQHFDQEGRCRRIDAPKRTGWPSPKHGGRV